MITIQERKENRELKKLLSFNLRDKIDLIKRYSKNIDLRGLYLLQPENYTRYSLFISEYELNELKSISLDKAEELYNKGL